MNLIGIGCDIEENKRFKNKSPENDEHFLKKIFTQDELNYCFSKKNYSENHQKLQKEVFDQNDQRLLK